MSACVLRKGAKCKLLTQWSRSSGYSVFFHTNRFLGSFHRIGSLALGSGLSFSFSFSLFRTRWLDGWLADWLVDIDAQAARQAGWRAKLCWLSILPLASSTAPGTRPCSHSRCLSTYNAYIYLFAFVHIDIHDFRPLTPSNLVLARIFFWFRRY